MPTIWDDPVRTDLVSRVRRLTPNHTAKWGKFRVSAMLAHVNDGLRMATGELVPGPNTRAPSFLRWPPVRYLFIHVLPIPKGAPTAPELLARSDSADLAQEQQTFQALFDALPRRDTLAATHPAFGRLSRDDWGALIHKHVDHHLRQFGV
jgi:hypothetical protein